MPLVHAFDLIRQASENRYALLEIRPRSLEVALRVADAAEACDAPVLVAIADDAFPGIAIADAMPALEAALARSKAPVALHHHFAVDRHDIIEAVRLGCAGVTLGALSPGCDLGELIGLGRACALVTEIPFQPALIVPEPLPDTLLVGASPEISAEAIRLLRTPYHLPISLWVTHVPANIAELLGAGVIKLSLEAADALALAGFTSLAEAAGSAGRGRQALAGSRLFAPVEHVVAFNAPSLAAPEIDRLFALGVEVLGAIPGVRQVRVGRAIAENARYRLCWFVRFANAAIAESYRNDPAHLAFADGHFRPVASDRLTIDYELSDR